MKKIFFITALLFAGGYSFAQAPDDILKYSFFQQNGTARSVAIGGAMGSLGGDISSLYTNPAGLGLYKTKEIVISPGISLNNNKTNYRGTDFSSSKSGFNLGTSGVVLGGTSPYSRNRSSAFSFGISQTANFNNTVTYHGQNDYSSYSEQYTEEISASGLSIDGVLNNPTYAFTSSLALDSYLVDTFANGTQLKGAPEFLLEAGGSLSQQKTIRTSGGIYELAAGYAANANDKFYYGFTVGVPILTYTRNTTFTESDASTDATNGFNYSELQDKYETNGIGVNIKAGVIYKPADFLRLGFAVHTPTFYTLTDDQSASMVTDIEDGAPYETNSGKFTDDANGHIRYLTFTPWKFTASGSYVFKEAADTRAQRGFITADIDYVSYPSAAYRPAGETTTDEDEAYYDDVKSVIKDYYKAAFNFRVGGELKFNTIMARLGAAYYGNPYKEDALDASIMQLSGGLGYRNKGIFVDLTYAHIVSKDINFPYRLQDKANTFAETKDNLGNVMLTLGFKL